MYEIGLNEPTIGIRIGNFLLSFENKKPYLTWFNFLSSILP